MEMDSFLKRLEQLERQVYGIEKSTLEQPSFRESLQEIDSILKSLGIVENSNVMMAWKNVEDIQRHISEEKENDEVMESVKLEFLLAKESSIREQAENLERLSKVAKFSEVKLSGLDESEQRMPPIVHVHVNQQASLQETSNGVKDLLTDYNKVMGLVSKQFMNLTEVP